MGFLKRFANSRIGAGSGDIILEEKDVPAYIKREKEALKFSKEGYLDVGKSDLSVLSSLSSPASPALISTANSNRLITSPSLPLPNSSLSTGHLRLISSHIEDNSNDIYKLMQRIELLERKIERIERLENRNEASSISPQDDLSKDNSSASFPDGLPF